MSNADATAIVERVRALGTVHQSCTTVARMLACGVQPLMVGPSGCGKSRIASDAARAMGLQYYYARAVRDEFALLGFRDAHGHYQPTDFRRAYEHGGVFLLDEMDASDPRALLAFNEAFANGRCDFPDGCVTAHADLHVIGAANTYGTGHDRQYVGRNQLDATSLDRFALIDVDYDHALEASLDAPDAWLHRVWMVRRAVEELGLRHVVSMRAIVSGARLLRGGFDEAFANRSVLLKAMPADQVARVEDHVREQVRQIERDVAAEQARQRDAERERARAERMALPESDLRTDMDDDWRHDRDDDLTDNEPLGDEDDDGARYEEEEERRRLEEDEEERRLEAEENEKREEIHRWRERSLEQRTSPLAELSEIMELLETSKVVVRKRGPATSSSARDLLFGSSKSAAKKRKR